MPKAETLSPASRKYGLRSLAFMGAYAAILVLMVTGALDPIAGTTGAWILSAAITAPILGQIWALLSYMRESDEFLRALTAKRFIIAAGLVISLFAGWGFAETFAGAPHIQGYWIYALFWFAFGAVTPLIRSSR